MIGIRTAKHSPVASRPLTNSSRVPGAEVTGILSNTLGVVPLGRPPSPAQPAMIERYGDDATNDLRSEAPGRELSLRDAGLRSRSRPRDGRGSNRPLAAVDDVGRAINPLILHGQTHGGIAQGVGQALLEESYYEPQSGQLLALRASRIMGCRGPARCRKIRRRSRTSLAPITTSTMRPRTRLRR